MRAWISLIHRQWTVYCPSVHQMQVMTQEPTGEAQGDSAAIVPELLWTSSTSTSCVPPKSTESEPAFHQGPQLKHRQITIQEAVVQRYASEHPKNIGSVLFSYPIPKNVTHPIAHSTQQSTTISLYLHLDWLLCQQVFRPGQEPQQVRAFVPWAIFHFSGPAGFLLNLLSPGDKNLQKAKK